MTNLRLVADRVSEVDTAARAENNRRRQARQWAERRANRGILDHLGEAFGLGGEEPPFEEIDEKSTGPSKTLTAAAPSARTALEGTGAGGTTSSARPENLRAFATGSRGADELLAGTPGTLRGHCSSYATSCSWATLDASSVISGYESWLAANEQDAVWADTVAQAFEDAGGGGEQIVILTNETLDAVLAADGVSAQRSDIRIDPPIAYGSPPTTGYSNDPVNRARGRLPPRRGGLGPGHGREPVAGAHRARRRGRRRRGRGRGEGGRVRGDLLVGDALGAGFGGPGAPDVVGGGHRRRLLL